MTGHLCSKPAIVLVFLMFYILVLVSIALAGLGAV
ncbi:MAG: hypothetical protein PWR29_15 [Methanolobus sp.]|nr:hypothetical protein [Methanolobus sp.]MDK2833268.1 hypothetical protein [Methanolobus sp.]MDK2911058.1 hypothetical protein [Methanolobus sp.]MDN5309005.1 hypothetical protein [Methanolobus sp.]